MKRDENAHSKRQNDMLSVSVNDSDDFTRSECVHTAKFILIRMKICGQFDPIREKNSIDLIITLHERNVRACVLMQWQKFGLQQNSFVLRF